MWQWVLAGGLILLNVATILIVTVVVCLLLRRARLSAVRAPAVGAADLRQFERLREEVAELVRQLDRLAEDINGRVARHGETLQALLADADQRPTHLRQANEEDAPSAEGTPAPRRARDQVAQLARQGIDPVEIARRMKVDVGEVELLLSLHRSAAARQT